jgi:imidazole glycerol-phosphate synthase subunit HisH
MGICLGLQLLFEKGFEDGTHDGLGLISGDCVRFTVDSDPEHKLKIPHMGWNTLQFHTPSPLFRGIAADSHVYFVHSYYVRPKDESVVAATTHYGHPFVCSVVKDNLMAVQFHPEKSQAAGLQILKNFAEF